METLFEALLRSKNFVEARKLLQRQMESGLILDPRDDGYWAPMADLISEAI